MPIVRQAPHQSACSIHLANAAKQHRDSCTFEYILTFQLQGEHDKRIWK
jgi:hypothetical protein